MNEKKVKEIVEKNGYIFDKIVRFKTCDIIRWHSEELIVSINLGKKIEDMTVAEFSRWVIGKRWLVSWV